MLVRKVINFGKNSHIITLPKSWVEKNNIQKGDVLSLHEQDQGLLISAAGAVNARNDRSITVSADGKELSRIKLEIYSAYLNNYNIIEVIGKDISSLAQGIKGIIHGLAGLEVLEQTSTKVVAKDLLNLQEISIKAIIRRMDIITKSMIEDTLHCLKDCECYDDADAQCKSLHENIGSRDKDINRLYYLAYRVIYGALRDSQAAAQLKAAPLQLQQDYLIIVRLERIADQMKGIAADLPRSNITGQSRKELTALQQALFDRYSDTMKAYYTNNKETAFTIEVSNASVIEKLENFLTNHTGRCIGKKGKQSPSALTYSCMGAARIIDGMKIMAKYTSYLARVIISMD
ncbi:phosphate uptake regulator PhoU [Candidatus Woesearchaeota archaeon]|nr:phosphate uptake regulator PhoU [Candidatus Woesearchaeota archaeon]